MFLLSVWSHLVFIKCVCVFLQSILFIFVFYWLWITYFVPKYYESKITVGCLVLSMLHRNMILKWLWIIVGLLLPISITPWCLGENHRAAEGAAGEGGQGKRRGDRDQQEGAEGAEGEGFPAAGWPCRPRGRRHTQNHTISYLCYKLKKHAHSVRLSGNGDWSITAE